MKALRVRCIAALLFASLLAVGAAWAQEDAGLDAARVTRDALELMDAGDTTGALAKLDESLILSPGNAYANYWIAYICRQKAASDPAMRQRAVAHAKLALATIRYGAFADRCRALLVKLVGRPKHIRFFATRSSSQEGKSDGTSDTLARMLKTAEESGLLSSLQENGSRAWVESVPTEEDAIRSLGLDGNGTYRAGWLVFVQGSEYAVKSFQSKTKKGVTTRWRADGKASITIADPIVGDVVASFSVETNWLLGFLLSSHSSHQEAREDVLGDLRSAAWKGIMRTIRAHSDASLADEMCIPTPLSKLYAVSRADTYCDARKQPLVVIPPLRIHCSADLGITEELENSIMRGILDSGKYAVVPSSCVEFCEKALQLQGWPAVGGHLEVCRGANGAMVLGVSLEKVNARVKSELLGISNKAIVGIDTTVRLYWPESLTPVVEKNLHTGETARRWGASNVDKLAAMLQSCLHKMATKITEATLSLLDEDRVTGAGSREAQPGDSKGKRNGDVKLADASKKLAQRLARGERTGAARDDAADDATSTELETHIAELRDPEAKVRAHAARVLGQSGSERAVDPLIAALGDDDPSVRDRCVDSLGSLGDNRAVDPLGRVLANAELSERERCRAAKALARIGTADAKRVLVQCGYQRYVKL